MTDVKLNFVTPINKIFPSPLSSSVFLVLNESGDLSLYRNKEHVWSAGRFKLVYNVEWSPDGTAYKIYNIITIICRQVLCCSRRQKVFRLLCGGWKAVKCHEIGFIRDN